MSKRMKILCILFLIFFAAAFIFSTLLIREMDIDSEGREFYTNIGTQINRRPENVGTEAQQTGDENTWTPYVDFIALSEKFPGITGWIKLKKSLIDYPVMQYTDNDHFLTHLPDGTEHRNGSIFLDYRNKSDFSDKSILIYGHETRAGDMFGALKNYRVQAFYETNRIINLYTPENDYEIVLFAGHIAHSITDHPPLHFDNDEEFLAYVQHLKSISVFESTVEVTKDDKIVSLVTCTYDFNDARLIIVGILNKLE